ncbi:MAG: PEGA domain-containing protein, partial [Myxococcales bacterium]
MRAAVLTVLLCVPLSSEAAAQPQDPWLIVPVTTTEEDSWIEPTAVKVRTELMDRGIAVWSLEGAATRFEAEGSAAPTEVSEEDVEHWLERSSAAVRNLATGDRATALEQLRQAQEFSHAAAEVLNREQELSRRVLDTCLFMVRALLETNSESRAEAMAEECRRLVPRGDPSAFMHPPAVIEALDRVDGSRADQPGTLRVDSLPSGCAVRVNGVILGQTPLDIPDLLPGRYRVQAECDPEHRGRVHAAEVIAGPAEVRVDLRFDRAIETDSVLRLRYESPQDRSKHHVADAEGIAKVVPAGALLLMSTPTLDVIELELYRGAPAALVGLARITTGPRGAGRGDIALAVRALLQDQCTDLTGVQPVAIPCEADPVAPGDTREQVRRSDRRPRGQFISGVTLAGVGAAALITGYALLAPRATVSEEWVNELDATGMSNTSMQQKWLSMGTGVIATSSVGAAALVTAM